MTIQKQLKDKMPLEPKYDVSSCLEDSHEPGQPTAKREQKLSGRKILVLIPTPFMSDRGTPLAVSQFLFAVSKQNTRTDVLTYPMGSAISFPGMRLFRVANPFRIKTVPVGYSLRKVLLDCFLAYKLIKLLNSGDYDCIHALEESAFIAVLVGRRFGIPVVYDMQSCMPDQLRSIALFRNLHVQSMLRRAERWLIRNSTVTVASLGLKRYVHAVVPGSRVYEWLFPGQEPCKFPIELSQLRKHLKIPRQSRIVLYAGTFEPYQGLETLVLAASLVTSKVTDAVFLLIGEINGARLKLTSEAEQLKESGKLKIIGRQPRKQMPLYLKLSDVVVCPRAYGDNLPLKIFDYMAAGCPIVATNIPAHREILNDNTALLVAPTAAALAGGIIKLLENHTKASELSNAAKLYSMQNLGWPHFTEIVNDVYNDALV